MIRYGIALGVAVLITAYGFGFAVHTRMWMDRRYEQFAQELKAKQEAGQLPPEWQDRDLEQTEFSDWGMELSARDKLKVNTAYAIQTLWYVWVPPVFAVCLGIAALIGRIRGPT